MIMLTKVINKNKPEQRTKSMHIFFYLFKVCLFLFYIYMYTFKVKDLQEFQGVSRGKFATLIYLYLHSVLIHIIV